MVTGEINNILRPIVDEATKVLIVGSMPSAKSLEKQQYYGNPRNHFWAIMGAILEVEIPEKYEKRLTLLKHHHIGLWDSIASCERQGSLDTAIRNEKPNDFQTFFQQYPQIELVLFNGTKAYDVFKRRIGFDILADRVYEKMPSTSPIPGKNIKSFEQKVEDWRLLCTYL
ncbi:DNA-deoxyinosine glycosylase [Lysinibacillus piscis]|uniref:DNA-deoxyinosine glycosylase n=1 Tax=Lysinibacillus piscis TaxID=2518931 RepID=A0ABQ5NMF3_9BACI|nr:DNA-deoxyinosine glycosylase [Lysinibacillus sp. KH24]GLC89530.1 DNA-deoxyinosine glycosylase [Lysinibacillus sp. KH24]